MKGLALTVLWALILAVFCCRLSGAVDGLLFMLLAWLFANVLFGAFTAAILGGANDA